MVEFHSMVCSDICSHCDRWFNCEQVFMVKATTTKRNENQWLKFSLPSVSALSQLSWPSLAWLDKDNRTIIVERTNPFRVVEQKPPNRTLSIGWRMYVIRLIIPIVIMLRPFGASLASAADEPVLLNLPELIHPTQPTENEIAKFLNRCTDYENVARTVVDENNRIWYEHERLIASEKYNDGLADGADSAPAWYTWAAVIGGSAVTGVAMGFMVALALVR